MMYQCALRNVMRIDFTLCSCKNKESRKIILGGDEYVHLAMVTDHRCAHISKFMGISTSDVCSILYFRSIY